MYSDVVNILKDKIQMNFIEAVEYLMKNPKGTKVKARNWDNDYIYIDKDNYNILKTQSGESYSPYPWTIVNDTFEVVEE